MALRELTPELAEIAQKELFEDPKRVKDDIQHLKDWIAKQPHLRARTDDQWLLAFLRGCKFSLERSKEKLDLYYTCRTTAKDMFRIKHTDPMFDEILSLGSVLILPKPIHPTGPLVVLIRPGAYDAEKYNIIDVMAVSNVMQKIIFLEFDNAVVAGTRTLLDLQNVGMGHFLQMTPGVLKKMVVIGQDSTPMRLKGTHYLNTPPGFETVFNAIKSLLNEKNKNRMYVHNKNYEEMYKIVPKEVLPTEYGGDAGSVNEIIDFWRKKVQEYSAWLTEDEKFGTDESRRPGRPRTAEDMFGIDGSFRQLEFD